MPDDKTPCQEVRDRWTDHLGYWQPKWDDMAKLRDFCAGERFKNNGSKLNEDRRLREVRGEEVNDTIRHVMAKVTEKARNLEARPTDIVDDPTNGEIATSLCEGELSNPTKGFDERFEDAVLSACKMRLGVVWMDFDPTMHGWGEIIFRYLPNDRVMWDEAYEDPHHLCCPWLITKVRLPVEEIKANWGADWVRPDPQSSQRRTGRSGMPISYQDNTGYKAVEDGRAEVLMCWYKNDKTTKYQETDSLVVPKDDRYMACATGCGYRSDTQGQLKRSKKIKGQLPPILEEGCPICSGNLERVDAKDVTPEVLAYAKGKRLVIVMANQVGPDDKPLYDGNWPIATARSFPGLFITCEQEPGHTMGRAYPERMWDLQYALDELRTQALQSVFANQGFWLMPKAGVENWRGDRFEFRDDDFNIMFGDYSMGNFAKPEYLKANGLDPNWGIAYSSIQSGLTQYIGGAADFSLGPDDSKDIAASTVAQLTQQAETQTEHFYRRINRALGKFVGVLWDYIRATYTPERLARLRIEGTEMLQALQGDDLPGFDFTLAVNAPFTGLEKARSQTFTQLMQVATEAKMNGYDPYAAVEIYAEINNLPASTLRKMEKLLASQAPLPMGGPGVPGGVGDATNPSDGGGGVAPAELGDEALPGSNMAGDMASAA